MTKKNNKIVGKAGEDKAYGIAQSKGIRILERNYRCRRGEIDLIGMDNDTLVFIEVKARCGQMFGLPEEAVGFYKQQKLRKLAMDYIRNVYGKETKCRFDVYALDMDKENKVRSYRIYENCF